MKKQQLAYLCGSCGSRSSRWQGSCHSCGAWDSITHSPPPSSGRSGAGSFGSGNFGAGGTASGGIRGGDRENLVDRKRRGALNQGNQGNQGSGKDLAKAIEEDDAGSLLRPLGDRTTELKRIMTGIDEFDRAVGGGIVPGSVLLLGGDPGVGKSTLALQVAVSLSERMAASNNPASTQSELGSAAVYISGEEDRAQLALRARRLESAQAATPQAATPPTKPSPKKPPRDASSHNTFGYRQLLCSAATCVDSLLGHLLSRQERAIANDSGGYALLVVDSIQTMRSFGAMAWDSRWDGGDVAPSISTSAGSLSSLRDLTSSLTHFARTTGITVLLIGHVTKEGQLAGPKQIEHMVDVVLYLEGERGHGFRLLRAVKNRFGALDEIGVFEMRSSGLCGVSNPSSLFLSARSADSPGTAVFASVEGTRPFLCEVQALVASAPPGTPRRTALGWDSTRLATLLAVLEAHAGLRLGGFEVYLNISGGLRVRETACDLAVACAIVSAVRKISIPRGWVFCGEIGLTGDVRAVGHTRMRAAEASKLGFTNMLLSSSMTSSDKVNNMTFEGDSGFTFQRIDRVSEITKWLANATVTD